MTGDEREFEEVFEEMLPEEPLTDEERRRLEASIDQLYRMFGHHRQGNEDD